MTFVKVDCVPLPGRGINFTRRGDVRAIRDLSGAAKNCRSLAEESVSTREHGDSCRSALSGLNSSTGKLVRKLSVSPDARVSVRETPPPVGDTPEDDSLGHGDL